MNQQPFPVEQKTNSLAIAGLVLAFLLPLLGLILSIIALTQIKKNGQKGKGIAIAGTIISVVVIIISALFFVLIVNSISGVQTKAQDFERVTDINAMHAQVESYFAKNGYYPSLGDLNSVSFRSDNMIGLSSDALIDPTGLDALLVSSPTMGSYSYDVQTTYGASCNNLTSSTYCKNYTLTAVLSNGKQYTKQNLNE